MDKYEFVVDVFSHPERYTTQQLEDMFSDPEAREIYEILCKTASAAAPCKEVDVEAEWKQFANKMPAHRLGLFARHNGAASITAIICTSVVAVAAGIAVTMAVSERHKVAPEAQLSASHTVFGGSSICKDYR